MKHEKKPRFENRFLKTKLDYYFWGMFWLFFGAIITLYFIKN